MRSSDVSLARVKMLYEMSVTPQRTREMLALLNESTAETAAFIATTVLCEYLNRWDNAGPDQVAIADAAITQALDRNPELFLAHYAQGFLFRARGQHQASLTAFDETIRYAPNFARAYAQKGEALVYLGRFRDGIAEVERALEFRPLSSVHGYFRWVVGRAWFFLGDDAQAIRWLDESIRAWRHVWYNRAYKISAHALTTEKSARQRAAVRRARRSFDRNFPDYTLRRVVENEDAIPNDNPSFIAGRQRFHDGLRLAGMEDG